jgi:hypothetical protein
VVTSVALDWLKVTVTVFALPPPQPSSHTEANAANTATQLAIFRNFIPPASPSVSRTAVTIYDATSFDRTQRAG